MVSDRRELTEADLKELQPRLIPYLSPEKTIEAALDGVCGGARVGRELLDCGHGDACVVDLVAAEEGESKGVLAIGSNQLRYWGCAVRAW